MSLLVYTTAWDRLGARKLGVGQKEEQKEKWRGGGKGSKKREQRKEEEGGVIISSPHVFIFSPLLSLAPSHSITQALRTARRLRRAFASWQTQPDKRLKAILITVSVCGSTATLEGPGEISERGNDRVEG